MLAKTTLPIPDTDARAHSMRLSQHIAERIASNGGQITFMQYMDLALYAPGLGYYSAGATKFGSSGDFVTAPELSPLFSQALAQPCEEVLNACGGGDILELGAGTGVMAASLLLTLEAKNSLPHHYYILEISPDLRERQMETLHTRAAHLLPRVSWLNQLPDKLSGVILANELIDALPVSRFHLEGSTVFEYYVRLSNGALQLHYDSPTTPELIEQIRTLDNTLPPPWQAYESEIHLQLPAFVAGLEACLEQGLVLLIDYGFPQHEFYLPERNQGTLVCHYRHHVHQDPLFYPGLQDISAHVNFTALAEYALKSGFDIAGYTTQAAFLLSCGLLDLAAPHSLSCPEEQWQQAQSIKKLTLPSEMGELFKVMGLTKQLNIPLKGFMLRDLRSRLGSF